MLVSIKLMVLDAIGLQAVRLQHARWCDTDMRLQVHRKTGTLAALSGADAMYKEFSTGAAGTGTASKHKGPSIRKLINSRRIIAS